MKKRIYNETELDYDRKLLPGLHHIDWKDRGESADHTRYGSTQSKLKDNEKKRLHKLLV